MPLLEKKMNVFNQKIQNLRTGSSHMSALFNLKQSSLVDFYMEKHPDYPTEIKKDEKSKPATYGTICEPILRKIFLSLPFICDKYKLIYNKEYYDESFPDFISKSIPDGILINNESKKIDYVIEFKCAYGDLWETPQPEHVLQLIDGMICVSDEKMKVEIAEGFLIYGKFDREAPSISQYDIKVFNIKRNNEISDLIRQRKLNFYTYLIMNRPPPIDTYWNEPLPDYEWSEIKL